MCCVGVVRVSSFAESLNRSFYQYYMLLLRLLLLRFLPMFLVAMVVVLLSKLCAACVLPLGTIIMAPNGSMSSHYAVC